MYLMRNAKLNGIELYVTDEERTRHSADIKELGWYYSLRKGHYFHTADEDLWQATKAKFNVSEKKPNGKAKASEKGAESRTEGKAKKTETKKAEPKKPDKPVTKKAEPKTEIKVEPSVEQVSFDISMAGFKADEKFGITELKVWKAAVLHTVEKILDEAIAQLVPSEQ